MSTGPEAPGSGTRLFPGGARTAAAPVLTGVLLVGLAACSANGEGGEGENPSQTQLRDDSARTNATGAGPAGCWALSVEDEAARDSLRVWLTGEMLPPILELDTVPTPGGIEADGPYRAFSWFDGRRETSPFSEWQAMDGDSVRVQRTGALSGLMLRMGQREDSLMGRLIAFTDVVQPGDDGRREVGMGGERVGCP